MQTIQVVLNEKLLKAADVAARWRKVNGSALIREALGEYLRKMRTTELDERDRRGYLAWPQHAPETKVWEDAAAWPED